MLVTFLSENENDKPFLKSWHIARHLVSCIPYTPHILERPLGDTMEFVPAPAVHRVLCADCGASIILADKAVQPSHAHPRGSDCSQLSKPVHQLPQEYVSQSYYL